uniref:Uncharacterized protein n=1 Tax=Megaselia scalaris TaxID=36166 RepID=T1GNH1_MEGSC
MKSNYDLSSNGIELHEGDTVLLNNPQRKKRISAKLTTHWEVYRIKLMSGRKIRVVHYNSLKIYKPTVNIQ